MKKRVFSVIMTLALVISVLYVPGGAVSHAASATPISTVEEFLAMENNPSGSYYLKNDIKLPANTMVFTDQNNKFKGTFDGRGHTIKGYTYTETAEYAKAGVFGYAWEATFKNVKLTNVNINVTGSASVKAGALVADGYECTLSNIKAAGKITASATNSDSYNNDVGGIAGGASGKKIEKCTSDVDISVKFAPGSYESGRVKVGGIAGNAGAVTAVSGCTNSGKITFNGTTGGEINASGMVAANVKKASNCKNTGAVTVTLKSGAKPRVVNVSGVAAGCYSNGSFVSCGNTGAVKVTGAYGNDISVAGVVAMPSAATISKCWNKGAVTVNTTVGGEAKVGGVFGYLNGGNAKLSYNKGKVTVTGKGSYANSNVGGLGGEVYAGVKNCYNAAAVSLSGEGNVGGVLGGASLMGPTVTCVYNVSGVTGKNKANKGMVIGTYSGADVVSKRNIYNNYYKGSGKAYGTSGITWKAWVAKANKVSSITSGNCPKLSSNVWTYSSKYKRLILKANKEK